MILSRLTLPIPAPTAPLVAPAREHPLVEILHDGRACHAHS